ncbi:hypothetical protein CYY_005598 [Polysphondylium violaceum]|uniref:glutamate--tRNA ligase n=1 Tax=Polysphondylium violaceum TaxID=133409 RepID=A0A8J4PT79_9MYCE|nr:hypothetical protein CYY_005598 [Polysphondylium violaceum]
MSKKETFSGILRYDDTPLNGSFPFVALITAKIVNNIKLVGRKGLEATELSISGTQNSLRGSYVSAKYIARTNPDFNLYGADAFTSSKIDEFIDKIAHVGKDKIAAFVSDMNEHLTLRSFLVGFNVTLADVALFARIKLNKEIQDEMTAKAKTIPHLKRWLSYVGALPAFAESEIAYTGSKPAATTVTKKDVHTGETKVVEKATPQKGAMGWVGNFEALNLPGLVEGQVVTRFPPEPSGFMHVGHCKAAIINNYYAEKYKGKIIIRFDDTNPSKEKEEYVENIIKDIHTLGIKYEKITHTSDYFDFIIEMAKKMIKEGNAYVDDTPVEKMREERELGIESVARSNSVEKNLELFDEMLKGSEIGVKSVMRAKADMKSVDKAFRDPAFFRCNSTPHHRTGDKYKAYPLYDFACPIVDSIEGITHALRSNEYHNKIALYNYVCEILGLRVPIVSDYSRLSFSHVLLSKRKLQQFVDKGVVDGWNDPRLPTLQGISRRGLTIDALKEFVLSQGASASNTTIDLGKLWAGNKNFLEPACPRYNAVAKQNVILTLTNGPATEVREILKYNKDPNMGTKKVTFSSRVMLEVDDASQIKENEEITLMNWGNAFVRTITRNEKGEPVSMTGELHLEGDFKKTEKKLSWLSADCKHIPVVLQDFDYLITKPKLEDEDDLDAFTTKVSKFELDALADENVLSLKVGDKIQFERRGFFNVDKVGDETKPYVLIYIPDSKYKPQGQALYPFKKVAPSPKPAPAAKAAPKK